MFGISRRSLAKRGLLVLALAAIAVIALVGTSLAGTTAAPGAKAAVNTNKLVLYSTTSVRDSGLMANVVLPAFAAARPEITVQPIYVGSGAAIQAARDGNADVIIVHSPADEKQLLIDGVATMRLPFAYNYFTIVGPKGDPAKIATATTAAQAFKRIARWGKKLPAGRVAFVSRGDASGTNKKELQLWVAAGVTTAPADPKAPLPAPTGAWYITAAGGMLPCLQVTAQKNAYTLTDTATWLANKANLKPLQVKLTKKADLLNQYSVILLNQAMHPNVNASGAEFLARWIVSNTGQRAIGKYGKSQFGQALFFPNAFTISNSF